ncbi:hypothetical protein MF672_039070 [Actinomadura sp. ATCC 31491]|uniref:Uncharacterized protein n=1 Tax=Actinomadura luzonensis TaxID=2805427 RepID=A0ABT0G598_9ACTN|nr:hypothetical protein [Actinomadura luzonensis]MCK2219757.1 hypothetical protein [Actinomadura luzonensis]
MTGPEHYHEGERLLQESQTEEAPEWVMARAQQAQAHFAAADAAATALAAALPLIGDDQQVTDWAKAIGVTFTTPDLVRIDDALALLDQLGQEGLIVPVTAERLREVLRRRNGAA